MAKKGNGYNLLVIDDSVELLDTISLIFGMNGFETFTSMSAGDIPMLLYHHKIHLLLIDIHLAYDSDGREVCKVMKANPLTGHIPVILMSASPVLLQKFKDYGADAALEKPFELEKLISQVHALLGLGKTSVPSN